MKRLISIWLCLCACVLLTPFAAIAAPQVPGISAALFNAPYYTCTASLSRYVDVTNGSDSNSGKAAGTGNAWKTLQHANDMLAANTGGQCVYVAPGTYTTGMVVTHGGASASAGGYVVYRCQTLTGCIVTDITQHDANGMGGASIIFQIPVMSYPTVTYAPANYVWFDGFAFLGSQPTTYNATGIFAWNGDPGQTATDYAAIASHHIWVTNSRIRSYGQSGVQLNNSEWHFIVHNAILWNARSNGCASGVQGSGVSFAISRALPGYSPTPDDMNNPVTGNIGAGNFHNAVMWNSIANNAETTCGNAMHPYDSDGNAFIMDKADWPDSTGNCCAFYPNATLVAFNLLYNNGGGGAHIFESRNVTVANNTCYNNYIDPYDPATERGCLDAGESYGGNTFENNIAIAQPAPPMNCYPMQVVAPFDMYNSAINAGATGTKDVFYSNITMLIGSTANCGGEIQTNGMDMGQYSTSGTYANQEQTNPMFVNAGNTSTGSETVAPNGANFALMPGSPAIGKGKPETYLSSQSTDIGACPSSATTCGP